MEIYGKSKSMIIKVTKLSVSSLKKCVTIFVEESFLFNKFLIYKDDYTYRYMQQVAPQGSPKDCTNFLLCFSINLSISLFYLPSHEEKSIAYMKFSRT